MEKTVYILGAGFSIDAKAPAQDKISQKIFEISEKSPETYKDGSIELLRDFLSSTMQIPEEKHSKIPLEDIFTPLDKCSSEGIPFRNKTKDEVFLIRENISYLIAQTMEYLLRDSPKNYVDSFAKYLVELSSTRKNHNYRNNDPVSVISTNWDILLDNSIKKYIADKYKDIGTVDYCFPISSRKPEDESIRPGLEMLGKGGFNVKLIKVHGSLNWLQCPQCQRTYVDFFVKPAATIFTNPESCRHCEKNYAGTTTQLISNLVMPTFLKNLSSAQYKLIWQNAGIEIAEASRLVFIGYSLPSADFEMRQLLSRMTRADAKIEVVTFIPPQPHKDAPIVDQDNYDLAMREYDLLKKRYEIFFGKRDPQFHTNGAKAYTESQIARRA